MRRSFLLLAVLLLGFHSAARATDVDGPDCGRPIVDFGDAPEGIPMPQPGSRIGHFPTCLQPGAPGDQTFDLPPISSPPGPTGYMRNVQDGHANYWLGCYDTPAGLAGIDSEEDAKVGIPFDPSSCSGLPTDCTSGLGQDECQPGDGDASIYLFDWLVPCSETTIGFQTANCGPPRSVFLNVLIDYNLDGDWNDNMNCPHPGVPGGSSCAYEWSVKNAIIDLGTGCEVHASPEFLVGPNQGFTWMRISLTDQPVADDFPWAGSANQPGGSYTGGETEDYMIFLLTSDPTRSPTWGQVKTLYR